MTAIVDIHVHAFPPRMFEAIWRFFDQYDWPVQRQQVSDIAATLATHGVDRAVALSYPHKPGVARSLNHFGMDLAVEHPVFLPFASVHVQDADLRDATDEAIGSPHLYGFKFQPLVQEFDVNDPRLDYLYEACLEADFPLLLHIGTAPYANPFVGLAHFDKLMVRFPYLRVCVAHMGSYEADGFLERLDRYPAMVLDTAMINVETELFDTRWPGDAEKLLRHADRVCYGSDWPNVPYPYQESLDSLSRFPFPESAHAALYAGNALRFLKLED